MTYLLTDRVHTKDHTVDKAAGLARDMVTEVDIVVKEALTALIDATKINKKTVPLERGCFCLCCFILNTFCSLLCGLPKDKLLPNLQVRK